MQKMWRFVAAVAVVAAVTLAVRAETTGSAATGQTYTTIPPNVSLAEWFGHGANEKVINPDEDNEFVNPAWITQEELRLEVLASAKAPAAEAWVLHSWWHRLNFDDAQPPQMVGPYTGDLIDTFQQPLAQSIQEVFEGSSTAMHYSITAAGRRQRTAITAVGNVSSVGMDNSVAGEFEPEKRVVRRGKDQSTLHGSIHNIEIGHWKIEFEASLKCKAGANVTIDPMNQLAGGDPATVDASAYGRLRVFLDGNIVAVDDGEARRTNKEDVSTGKHNIETQYGTSTNGGYATSVNDSWGHEWNVEGGDDYFFSTYDVIHVKSPETLIDDDLELDMVYSSYAYIRNEVQPNEGSGTTYTRVTHGKCRVNAAETYSDYKDDLSAEDKAKLQGFHPWAVTVIAYDDSDPDNVVMIRRFTIEGE